MVVPQSSIHHMQVRSGTQGHARVGALVGGIVGLLAGVAMGSTAAGSNSQPSGNFEISLPVEPIAGGLFGFVFGILAGSAMGSAVRTDQWQNVDTDLLATWAIKQPSSPPALGFSVQF